MRALWSETFPATYVITVDGAESSVERLMSSLPILRDLCRIDSCPRGVDPETGLPEANHHVIVGNRHKRIIREAKKRRLPGVLVFEDDAEFVGDVASLTRALEWIRSHSTLWDVFYLGFSPPFPSSCLPVDEGIIQAYRPFQAHAICYSEGVYDALLSIDLSADHRPGYLRPLEAVLAPVRKRRTYHRDGVASIDSWLASSNLRRLAADPLQFVQTRLPPGTEAGWQRYTLRRYDVYRTPQEQVKLSLMVGRIKRALGVRFDRVPTPSPDA